MLPQEVDPLQNGFELGTLPTRTYRLDLERGIISGHTGGLEAVRQAAYLILNVERYQYPIYSWGYGVELAGLFGKPSGFVLPELERRIREALTQDDRITAVDGFTFTRDRGKITAHFTVHTTLGEFEAEKEAEV